MKVLFSPIGNSDPWSNDRDGAMLHIVRHYKPDVVVLFLLKAFGMVIEIYLDVKLRLGKHCFKSIIENKSGYKSGYKSG